MTASPVPVRPEPRYPGRMAEDTEYVMSPEIQRLFDAAGMVSTPEGRRAAQEKIAAAEARMARPGAWDELRAKLGLPPRTA